MKIPDYGLCWAQEGGPSGTLLGTGPPQLPSWGFIHPAMFQSPPSPHPHLKSPFCLPLFSAKCIISPRKAHSPVSLPAGALGLETCIWSCQQPPPGPSPPPQTQHSLDSFPRKLCCLGRDLVTVPTKLPSSLQTFVLSTELQKTQFMLLMSSLFG